MLFWKVLWKIIMCNHIWMIWKVFRIKWHWLSVLIKANGSPSYMYFLSNTGTDQKVFVYLFDCRVLSCRPTQGYLTYTTAASILEVGGTGQCPRGYRRPLLRRLLMQSVLAQFLWWQVWRQSSILWMVIGSAWFPEAIYCVVQYSYMYMIWNILEYCMKHKRNKST